MIDLNKEIEIPKQAKINVGKLFLGFLTDCIASGLLLNLFLYSPLCNEENYYFFYPIPFITGVLLFFLQFFNNDGTKMGKLFFSMGVSINTFARVLTYLFWYNEFSNVKLFSVIALIIHIFFTVLNMFSAILIKKGHKDLFFTLKEL